MREFAMAPLLLSLLLAACAGGSSRYGCPAESGYSCKSVSEVYAEAASGQKSGEHPFLKFLKNKKSVREAAGRRFLEGGIFRAGKNARKRAVDKEVTQPEKTMPVYVPPRTIRLWIAPWQDARGVFHSGKHVYVISGRGRWTVGGKTVPLGESPEDYPGEIRLLGTEGAP
jgi:conjugal transfer pilus assembly protein TraV